MTPEERASDVLIVQEDRGDRHVADWRVNFEKTADNIAAAIREAVAVERERCAKIAEEYYGAEPDKSYNRPFKEAGDAIARLIREAK